MRKIDLDTLFDMLRYRRPQGSDSQREFCRRFLEPVFDQLDTNGNYLHHVGNDPNVVFSAHHDTVHRQDGIQRIRCKHDQDRQRIEHEEESKALKEKTEREY